MNAFTSSDWTAYPFASQSRKDYDNLLQVYLDAVFFPRLAELDFAQEGHRIEFANPDDPTSELVFKGVVFNEMKGAMSSPVSRLWRLLYRHLFPTITYHHNSGGEPEDIPDLTYGQLKEFHARHYHPSNAIFMTYGDIPAMEHHERFQEYALGHFIRQEMDLAVPDERRYTAPIKADASYPVDGSEGIRDKTHIVLGWLLGNTADLRETLKAHLLSGVLLDNSASPLRYALETTELGNAPSELCGLDDSPREVGFYCGVEGSNPEVADQVEELILGVIRKVAEEGVTVDVVESVLHQLELSQREITGGHFPYGLRLMVNALSSALHGGDPAATLNIDPVLNELREMIREPDFIKGLAQRLLLDNLHRVRLVMSPDDELSRRQSEKEAARLAEMKNAMSREEQLQVVEQAGVLRERQLRQDDPGVLPKVGLEDAPRELPIAEGEAGELAGQPANWFAQGTNGLAYSQVVVDLPHLDEESMDLLPLFCDCVTEVGCGGRDYIQAQTWQAAVTGGVAAHISYRGDISSLDKTRGYFVLSGKSLVRNQTAMAEVLREVFAKSRFDELPRLRELIAQLRAQREMAVTDHGHVLAMTAACAGMGPAGYLSHRWNGLHGIRYLKELDSALNDEARLAAFAVGMEKIRNAIVAAPRQFLVVCEGSQRDGVTAGLEDYWTDETVIVGGGGFAPSKPSRVVREAWAISSQVNFCSRAYPTAVAEHKDAAVLIVLGRFLTNGYLHRAIREQGGAYGAGAGYDSDTGAFRFYSYRDPRIDGTLDDFDRSLLWLRDEKHEFRQLEEAILGIVSAIDRPESPVGEAAKSFFGTLHGRTPEQRRRFRQRVLAVTLDDLLRVGETWFIPDQASTAVVGDSQIMKEKAVELGLELHSL
ncbi:MAG: peptidase M16 [Gammaproteobacteria bacterium]|nr:peptidase M16 [Gammaproteobacteria bacterium]